MIQRAIEWINEEFDVRIEQSTKSVILWLLVAAFVMAVFVGWLWLLAALDAR